MSSALLCRLSHTFALRGHSSWRYRSHPRASPVRTGVACQPPGDHDENFSHPVPSFRGEPAEEVDHVAREHHPMSASVFFPPPFAVLGPRSVQRLTSLMKVYEAGLLKLSTIYTLISINILYKNKDARLYPREVHCTLLRLESEKRLVSSLR